MTSADEALDRVLGDGARRAAMLGPAYRGLWLSLEDACAGGKRFRPALVLATHEALGGRFPDAAAAVGAGIELLHTAFVVHDDVIDGDHVRRGRLNVSGRFAQEAGTLGATDRGVRTYADTAGILAGDLALVAAVRAVATCGAPADVLDRLLDLVDVAVQVTAAGELADVRLGVGLGERGSLSEALSVSERKTAVYSFALPLQAGALLAEAPDELVAALGQVGRLLGIGFQLVDDIVGVFGDERVTGKSTLTDLREGKHTPLVAHARSTAAWSELAGLIGDPDLDRSGADRARALLVDCGSHDFVADLALDYVETALGLAREHRLPEPLLDGLDRLVSGILRAGGYRDGVPAASTRQPVRAEG